MLRLVLLDLGDTLVRGGELFPHVIPALEAIAQLETADGEPLVSGLVSDYPLAEPPAARGAARLRTKPKRRYNPTRHARAGGPGMPTSGDACSWSSPRLRSGGTC